MAEGTSVGGSMSEGQGGADVPVNPYSLLEAVNGASAAARNSWVLFLALMTYLLIAVAGVTHTDLLLNSPIPLPVLQVKIELRRFFLFAPIVLLFLHFGLLIQHAMLARKVLEFDSALRALEPTSKRTHPLRLELHSYFFTQALAGPVRSWLFGAFLQAMIWLSFVVIPVIIILYTQVVFLPFHDELITWVHRVTLLTDILILILIGVFLRRPEASFLGALWRTMRHNPGTFLVTSVLLVTVVLFSFFVATIPGEALDRLTSSLPGYRVATAASAARQDEKRYVFGVTAFLFEGNAGEAGPLQGFFQRNLTVTDEDLVSDTRDGTGEISINLRERDLRYARLDRSDLHRADLTGARLDGASLVGADLRHARLSCPDIGETIVFGKQRNGECTVLRGADLSRADLSGADLSSADITGAKFKAAKAVGAKFTFATLVDAKFEAAKLQRADFSGGADLSLADFLGAQLQGADFSGAKLLGAEFLGAELQGAVFAFSQLEGANFQGATLDAANLAAAKMHGADLFGASFRGASLVGARIWLTVPPEADAIALADLSKAALEPPSSKRLKELKALLKNTEDERVRKALEDKLAHVFDGGARRRWGSSRERDQWRELVGQGTPADPQAYRERLTRYLARIMCQVRWSDGAVASGIIDRALNVSTFQGDPKLLFERLTAPDCPASKVISEELVRKLSAAIEQRESAEGGAPEQ